MCSKISDHLQKNCCVFCTTKRINVRLVFLVEEFLVINEWGNCPVLSSLPVSQVSKQRCQMLRWYQSWLPYAWQNCHALAYVKLRFPSPRQHWVDVFLFQAPFLCIWIGLNAAEEGWCRKNATQASIDGPATPPLQSDLVTSSQLQRAPPMIYSGGLARRIFRPKSARPEK